MRRGQGVAPLVLGIALVLPPLLNLVAELRRLRDAGPPPDVLEYGFGRAPADAEPPPEERRGRYVPGRVVDFSSPSPFVSTFFVHFPRREEVRPGAVVIAPGRVLAGRIVKVWPRAGLALARVPEDADFRVACSVGDARVLLTGRGDGAGLEAASGSLADFESEIVQTSGDGGVYPPRLLVGFRRKNVVLPAFSRTRGTWVYLWYDPDLEALAQALGAAPIP